MKILIKDFEGNILFEAKEDIKAFASIELSNQDVARIKTFTGNVIMNDITEADFCTLK